MAELPKLKRKRRLIIWGGVVFLAVLSVPLLTTICWQGSIELDVHVRVIDASTLQPIHRAEVTLFERPVLHFIPVTALNRSHLTPGEDAQHGLTAEDGIVEFQRRFEAGGSYLQYFRWLGESGSIDTANTWVRIRASGHSTVFVPVSSGLLEPRDLKNESPVSVTVLIDSSPE